MADEQETYSAEEVSQGATVLRAPFKKAIFIGGLALAASIALLFGVPHHP